MPSIHKELNQKKSTSSDVRAKVTSHNLILPTDVKISFAHLDDKNLPPDYRINNMNITINTNINALNIN